MTVTEQTLALFGGIAVVLVVASAIGWLLQRRYAANGPNAVRPQSQSLVHGRLCFIDAFWYAAANSMCERTPP